MSKKYNIKWRDKDTEKLQNKLKEYNRIVSNEKRKLKRRGEDISFLPESKSFRKTKKNINSREDYNRLIKSLENVKKRNALKKSEIYGFEKTNYERKEVMKKQRRIKREREIEEEKRLETFATSRGEVLGQVKEMGTMQKNELKPTNVETGKNITNWGKFVEALENKDTTNFYEKKYDRWLENYKTKLIDRFGETNGNKIIDLIKGMDRETVIGKINGESESAFNFAYDVHEDYIVYNALLMAWGGVPNESDDYNEFEDFEDFEDL